uniref:Chromodomain helicase DNA binding protein 6 n=1 Tax=Scleropages formosus TaxID=113540 RepID=A0A8C9SX71_SCLFO
MSTTQILKHTSSSVASSSTDQNAQNPFPSSPLGLQEQTRAPGGLTNHCMAHAKQAGSGEPGPGAGRPSPSPLSLPLNGEEDDGGGGGARVKKKRKKKDKKEVDFWQKSEKETRPKKKKEVSEGKELLPRKSKELKKVKELKPPKESKKGRKSREAKARPKLKVRSMNVYLSAPLTSILHSSREQGPLPLEKKKKGKRKSEALQEMCESDESASLCTLAAGNEESSDKRRSGRQVKRRKYNEDLDFKVVDDDGETIAVLGTGRIQAFSSTSLAWQSEEPPEDEANIIEKILAVRTVKKEVQPTLSNDHFYVHLSYLHCKWATLEELEKDPRIHQKIKRFRNKQAQMKHIFTEPDEDLFNPDYIEVDRLLEVAYTTDTETGEEVTHYLVKWCSLPYEESTWELQEDVDPAKIREFEDIKKIPELKHVERPLPEQWKKLEQSREYRNGNQLREYQLEGMNWLLFNWYNRKNCILADEMGLGKTIQSITFLYEIFSMGIKGPFLIIAPLSTITNWEREFRTWTEMNVIVYHGSQISRQMILQYEMYHKDEQSNPLPGMFKFHGVITTFEMIMADCPELKKIHWRCVVIDEAHRLKNRNCKLLEGLKLMNLEHKVLLTGTPLQNSVEELFSLLNFLEPLQFPSETSFLEEFGDLKTDEQVKKLQAILKPMMLRRLKDDVEKNLAPKEETIIEVELTNIQKKYYRAILEKNFTFLAKGANQHNMPNLINTMMELRKCCNHPYLITGAEEKILEGFKKMHNPDAWDFQLQAMIQAAGKLVLIDKLLPKLIAGGHKVLIFSQMVRCLDILEDYLIQRRYTYERIDGRVRGNLRQAAIDRFCKVDSDRFVFLLCTRAGGLGINLTAADTCIIFDSDWNPQNDLQAQARCHRIGQSKAVKVYRLITRNSYEREMFDKASLKLGLDKAVLQDINRKGGLNGVQQLTKMEVEDLLRKGAYGALMDEEDEGSKFCEEDIDQILQRRTQTITIQTEGKGSTFAKASFVSSGNRTDISLDDPNFWQKWAKIAELEIDSKAEKESLVIDTPRVRKQTRHYNSFEEDELMEFSELDSDSEERPCRTRRLSERNRRYLRAECFRVEKNLLIFGWGRWKDILTHGRFKWHLSERDMELLCRALLVYCVRHYKGDDKIKSFIWDLITPTKDGQNEALQNHSGLSVPVPRGRKGKKLKNQLCQPELKNADWLVHCNPEVVLQDDSYKKHLKQHCNKVLLRVRMLYYLKVEVLGEAANQALEGIPASKLEVALPDIDYLEIPASWWDTEADKSLLIGVHKHGYERYNAMRADADLCFLERVGMPDVTALSVEQSGGETSADATDRQGNVIVEQSKCLLRCRGVQKRTACSMFSDNMEQGRAVWPTGSALTARLRRLITAYQRFTRREPLRHDFLMPEGAGPMAWQLGEEFRRMSSFSLLFFLSRWTRREQADFYRTVSSFGVVYDPEKKAFDWTQFRSFARLERKTDESLERYFCSFVAMCRTACRLPPRKDEGPLDPTLFVEPITEERAARTLYRIELLRKVREQVLRHPLLGQRLQLCQPSLYLPVWWECGKHDRDLLIGVARHGLSRTDYYILNDPQLSFLEAHRNYVQKENRGFPHCHSPQPAEFHPSSSHHTQAHIHSHIHTPSEVVGANTGSHLGVGTTAREGYLDCPSLDESLDLNSLQHDSLTSDSLHGKPTKEALNGFPFNSVSGGQNMLNSYGVQGELNGSQGDMDPIPGKLRSDVLVGEQYPCEDTGLIAPSVELDELQAPWESTDHTSTSDMFNESDAILGPSSLEPEFLDTGQPGESRVDGALTDCLSMPSSDSQSNTVEPLQPTLAVSHCLTESLPFPFPALLEGSYVEESRFTAPLSVCEMTESLPEVREPTIAHLLQEKALYSFSEWPKDRVIINRIDSICHAVLKGKWPSSQQYESPSSLGNTCVPNSAPPRAAYIPARVQSSCHLQESLVGVPFLAELKRGRRGLEFEGEAPGKSCPSVEKIPVGMPHRGGALLLNGWQDAAMDLSKAGELGMAHAGHTGPHKLPPLNSLPGSLGLDMAGILQAGLIHPVTGQIVNGSLRRDDAAMRRRRGRRRNVDGADVGFVKNQDLHVPEVPEGVNQSTVSVPSSSAPPEHPPVPPQPESLPLDRETANKGLLEWLRQNPNYTMEIVGILHSFVDRPKQRRHRCKDPSKLDVNSLTGEERVPVVHRATGRRGFLPEGKFTRILTEPVCRDSGPRKRGRRPRNDMPKVGAMLSEAHSSMGPLFMNGLIGNMDLMGLRNMPSIPLTGLMGFPHGFAAVPAGEDAKNGLSMLPMMLHGMQPHVFSVGGLMSQSATAGTPTPTTAVSSAAASPASSSDLAVTGASAEGEPTSSEADAETKKEDKPLVEGKAGPAHSHGDGSGGGSGSHLAFNPFLIPGMSHGLLYPHMFLPHGGIMALPSMPHADSSGSPKRKKKKLREEGAEEAGVKGSPM